MHDITFLRHAESEGNAQAYLQGQVDSPLTSQGEAQARRLAERWKANGVNFDRVISSPLQRACTTAQIVASELGAPLELDPTWIERSFGQLDGNSYQAVRQQTPPIDFFAPYEAIGGTGESQVDLYLRACRGIQDLLRRPPANYLVVSHGAILGKVMYAIFGITPQGHYNSPVFRFGNLAYLHFSYDPEHHQWNFLCFASPDLWDGQLPQPWRSV